MPAGIQSSIAKGLDQLVENDKVLPRDAVKQDGRYGVESLPRTRGCTRSTSRHVEAAMGGTALRPLMHGKSPCLSILSTAHLISVVRVYKNAVLLMCTLWISSLCAAFMLLAGRKSKFLPLGIREHCVRPDFCMKFDC